MPRVSSDGGNRGRASSPADRVLRSVVIFPVGFGAEPGPNTHFVDFRRYNLQKIFGGRIIQYFHTKLH